MRLPYKISYKRAITAVWALYGLVWIALEGSLPTVITMGISTTAVLLFHLLERLGGRRVKSIWLWVGGTAVFGAMAGVTAIGLTLIFMVLKTGLHAHGPEFSPEQIRWIITQLGLWLIIGSLIGGGLGMLVWGIWAE